MLTDFIKFFHLIVVLGLLGSASVCLILAGFNSHPERDILIRRLSRVIFCLLGLAFLTGTLLVYPKNYTFHTPWIQAAYLLVLLSGVIVLLFMYIKNKSLRVAGYFFLIMILIGIVHDAVTKTVFF